MNTIEFLKSKWQVFGGSVIIAISIFAAGWKVKANDENKATKSDIAAIQMQLNDNIAKHAKYDSDIAVIKESILGIDKKQDVVIQVITGINLKYSSPTQTSPLPLPNK
jgi:hypothetical protein